MPKTDIEIAQSVKMKPISEIASKLDLKPEDLELYGQYKAKINYHGLADRPEKGKVILVTAITPTPAGEGKTTVSVGLCDAMNSIGKSTAVALREPSLGPVFGVKGGAAGGGYSQVVPMEDINLHFTGDFHAIGAANNLLAAIVDNHIFHGNALGIDERSVTWKRAVDMNDRQLRQIIDGIGGKTNGIPREDGFEITVASEIMAILCLAKDLEDLKAKVEDIVVAYKRDGSPVFVRELNCAGAVTALLKDAIKPNLVQTLEHNPAVIHGGPFANIAHGCNSVIATQTARRLADYVVTEAGFGADLGAEKFIDIKCRKAGIKPSAVVVVATIRALKMHGGVDKTELKEENIAALIKGLPNLQKHVENVREVYGLPCVVAINKFPTDTAAEVEALTQAVNEWGVRVALADAWANGGKGSVPLAEAVLEAIEKEENHFQFVYDEKASFKEKIEALVTKVYGGKGAEYTAVANRKLREIEALGYGHFPVCMAKTQYSFTDKAKQMGRPTDFTVQVRDIKLQAGAGFIVVLTGNMLTMPGLPKTPAAEKIDINNEGQITGLF